MRGFHKGAFTVDEPSGSRFELALDLFRSGRGFEFQDIAFRIGEDNFVHCIIDSSWSAENVTYASAEKDLTEGESAFVYLLEQSQEFASEVNGRPVCFDLIEDYGNGSTLICSRKNGVTAWAHGYPRTTVQKD